MKKLRLMIVAAMTVFSIGLVPAAVSVPTYAQSQCGSTKTQLIACSGKTGIETIGNVIKIAISVLTVLIGIAATGGLAYAGILYASAQDDQGKVSAAKVIIRNVAIGIVLYGFTIAIINWLIPGGVIG